MLVVKDIRKTYNDFTLDLSLRVLKGHITGLVGENGAGKTTLFKLILNLIKSDDGNILLFDKDIKKFNNKDKTRIGVVLAESTFCSYFNAKDIISIMEKFYPKFNKTYYLDKLNKLNIPLDKKIQGFSTGMKAKLKLVIALSHEADFLILDEITAGLDVIARDEILKMLQEYMEAKEDRSILISSHISNDLETICDDIYMINQGKIILHEDTDVILNDYGIVKVDVDTFNNLDKSQVLSYLNTTYSINCLVKNKKYYQENYPKIIIEKASLDSVIEIMLKGVRQC